ncbi:TPA: oligosaccharide flippase family protein [Enterobacter cloacae]|nr:oligosaccharide flippase family protein [Enterobacter cloacae]
MSLGNSLLAKIEKVNNVVVGLGTNLVGNIIMFLTTIYITNNVTEQVYGEFRLTFALISILVLALMLGRDSSVLYFYQKEQKDSVIFEEAMSGLLLIAVGCIILYIFDGFFIRTLLSNQVSKDSYHLSLLMIPLWAAYNLLTPVVRLKGFVNSSFILSNLLQRFLRFPFLVIFIVLGYNGFAGLAWSMILSQILLLGILIYYLSSVVEWTSPSIKSFVKRFGYALSLGVNSIMLAIAGKIDVLILGNQRGKPFTGEFLHGHAFLEIGQTQAGTGRGVTIRRQNVVGAGGVIARGLRGPVAEENRTCTGDAVDQVARVAGLNNQVLRAVLVGDSDALVKIARHNQAAGG